MFERHLAHGKQVRCLSLSAGALQPGHKPLPLQREPGEQEATVAYDPVEQLVLKPFLIYS